MKLLSSKTIFKLLIYFYIKKRCDNTIVTSLVLKTQYGNPMVFITENGVSEKTMCTELCDDWRIQYYKDYINEMLKGKVIFYINGLY